MPGTGRVILHGKDVTNLPARLRGTGVIFQSYALFPKMNIEQNIAYGLKLRRRSKSDIKSTLDRLVEMVHLEDHRRKYPSQLSGGQQQRVAIARALAYEPEVLLFDEPFGALDAQIRGSLRREIRTLLKEIKVPSIFITHDQEEALELGDRIAVLNSGRIEQIGTPYDVYSNPATEYVATFLARRILSKALFAAVHFNPTTSHSRYRTNTTSETASLRNWSSGPKTSFLRRPENLMQNYQKLTEGVIEEMSFVGAFERVGVRLETPDRKSLIVTRPKTETGSFHLSRGQKVTVGVVRFRILPDLTKPPLHANRAV
jgi:ABC-type Fe3+/spermidine/putrescine transport system ATPase subunit